MDTKRGGRGSDWPAKPRLVPELLQRTEVAEYNDDPERALVFARAAHELIIDQLGNLDRHPPALVDSYQRVARLMSEIGDHGEAADFLLELIEEAGDETMSTATGYPFLLFHELLHLLQAGRKVRAALVLRKVEPMLRERLEERDWMLGFLDVLTGDDDVENLREGLERENVRETVR